MCDYKKPFEQVAAQDSRNLADIFNKVGWQGAEDEAKHNVQNPGRAITKAAISAATWYLGNVAGGYLGSGGSAADTGAGAGAGAAADAGGTTADALAAATAFGGNTAGLTTSQAMQAYLQAQQGLAQAGGTGLLSAGSAGAANALPQFALPAGTQLAAPVSDGAGLLQAPAQVVDHSQNAGLIDQGRYYASKLLGTDKGASTLASGSNTGKAGNLAMQMGVQMLTPKQPQQPMSAPPTGGQQQGPLTLPYGQQPYQNGGGPNSLSGTMPPPGMSYAEWLRRKQMGLLS